MYRSTLFSAPHRSRASLAISDLVRGPDVMEVTREARSASGLLEVSNTIRFGFVKLGIALVSINPQDAAGLC